MTIPEEYRGWWRIVETSQWADDSLDLLGPAMFSINGRGDRWRMIALLADVDWHAARGGLRFSLNGSWEFDPTSATGTVKLGSPCLMLNVPFSRPSFRSMFIAERAEAPASPIPEAPSYRDKWRRW